MDFVYKGLTAQLERHIVTAEEADRQIHRLLQQSPRIAAVTDRPTELGDEVVLDYAGFCDGEQFAGGTAEYQTLTLGSGMFIPGFEEQLVDKVPGEEVIVKVTFPTEYHSEALAGKAAEFRCKIHEIRIKTPYDLDDTFAKEVGGCETLEEMRQKLTVSLQAYADERGEMELQDNLLRQAAETLNFNPSESQMNAELDEQMRNLSAQLAHQGLNIQMYCQFLGTTEEALREEARPTALQAIRGKAAIEQIVAIENLEASQEEIGEALAIIARQNNLTLDQLKAHYDAEFEHAVVQSILSGKAMALIRDNATVTVVEK